MVRLASSSWMVPLQWVIGRERFDLWPDPLRSLNSKVLRSLPLMLCVTKLQTAVGWHGTCCTRSDYSLSGQPLDDNSGVTFKRTRHLTAWATYLRERIAAGNIQFKHRPTRDMEADLLTKPVSKAVLIRLKENMCITPTTWGVSRRFDKVVTRRVC